MHAKRLADRVASMDQLGLREEITNFCDTYYAEYQEKLKEYFFNVGDTTEYKGIFQTIGLKEFLPFLELSNEERKSEAGEKLYQKCCKRLVQSTIAYVRRQEKRIRAFFLRKPERQLPWVYPLDATDISKWPQIYAKSCGIVDAFLKDEKIEYDPLPVEPDLNGGHAKMLIYCDLCDMHCMSRAQFEAHERSKGHRYHLKKQREDQSWFFSFDFG